ncbi:hypothetical protein BKA69DRAFT_1053014 [Paraphysoderma sedebokerense]|nr:hypothetical protein BKA69DRAFT_1053014 [Paraphysoderma sedebokerense]
MNTDDVSAPQSSVFKPNLLSNPGVESILACSLDDTTSAHSIDNSPSDIWVASGSKSADAVCPICLSPICNKSYVQQCYHSFCFDCIRQWCLANKELPDCPLCKAEINIIYHSIDNGRKRFRKWSPKLTASTHHNREVIYHYGLEPQLELVDMKNPSLRIIKGSHMHHLMPFLERDLKMLLADCYDDIILKVAQDALLLPSKSKAKTYDDVVDILEPYLFENARQFVEEMKSFLIVGRTMKYYDENVLYGASNM